MLATLHSNKLQRTACVQNVFNALFARVATFNLSTPLVSTAGGEALVFLTGLSVRQGRRRSHPSAGAPQCGSRLVQFHEKKQVAEPVHHDFEGSNENYANDERGVEPVVHQPRKTLQLQFVVWKMG